MPSEESTTSPVEVPTIKELTSVSWWIAAINTVVLEVVTVVTLIHPGFVEPSWVQGVVPAIGQVMATAVWLWALAVHKAAINAVSAIRQAHIYAAIPQPTAS